jgi:hypothetical protein
VSGKYIYKLDIWLCNGLSEQHEWFYAHHNHVRRQPSERLWSTRLFPWTGLCAWVLDWHGSAWPVVTALVVFIVVGTSFAITVFASPNLKKASFSDTLEVVFFGEIIIATTIEVRTIVWVVVESLPFLPSFFALEPAFESDESPPYSCHQQQGYFGRKRLGPVYAQTCMTPRIVTCRCQICVGTKHLCAAWF